MADFAGRRLKLVKRVLHDAESPRRFAPEPKAMRGGESREPPDRIIAVAVLHCPRRSGWAALYWLHPPGQASAPARALRQCRSAPGRAAFNDSERIAAVLVQEGDRVHKGEVLARLDTSRLEPQVAQAEAQVAAQRRW